MQRQIILDTETTGLSPKEGHRIIEIGCIELIDRQFTGNYFHHYINPERDIDVGALRIHGITKEKLLDKPLFKDIAEELILFIKGAELIIHNAPFDVGFLDFEFTHTQKNYLKVHNYSKVVDSLEIARKLHPGQRNSLDALCKRYQVDNSHRDFHGALLDAKILAEVYLLMTGGQDSFFGLMEANNILKQNTSKTIIQSEQPYLLVAPTEEELAAHKEYLKYLEQQSGEVVEWE